MLKLNMKLTQNDSIEKGTSQRWDQEQNEQYMSQKSAALGGKDKIVWCLICIIQSAMFNSQMCVGSH